MQTLNVSLVVRSNEISLAELTRKLGKPKNEISFEKGRKVRLPSKGVISLGHAIWAIESNLSETEPLDGHVKKIIKKVGGKVKLAKKQFGNKVSTSLNIGVFFNTTKTANAVCHINVQAIEKLLPFVDVIEVSAYPCSS